MFSAGFFADGFFADGFFEVAQTSKASLGGWPAKKRKKAHEDDEPEGVSEALPADVVSRIRNEILSASLAQDVIARAKSRAKRMRSEEEALLLML